MFNYTLRSVLMFIPMVIVISFLIFFGMELMPGDAVDYMLSPDALANISPAELDALREALGLNDPFLLRYVKWLFGLFQGNFGYSLQSGVPVSELLSSTLPATLQLSVVALLLSTVFGSILGMVSALRKGTIVDNILSVAGMIGVAIPQFLFGLICIVIFAFNLEWLPSGGQSTYGVDSILDKLQYIVLPGAVLALSLTAGVMRYSRSSMLDSLNKDYIKTARSKGVAEWRVNLIHGFRVAMTPVVVLIGFRLPMLIGGAVVVEQIFQWPGVGMLFVAAVRTQNTPVVMMIAFFSVLVVLVSSLIVDLCTALLDPRVKLA